MTAHQTHRRWFQFRMSSFLWLMVAIACFYAGRNWDSLYGKNHVRIRVGESTTLPPQGPIARVSVGNPDVCEVIPMSSNLLQVVGKKKGSTTIETWDGPDAATPTKHSIIVRR